MACKFSDESHGALDGCWCLATGGHVDESQNCSYEFGYEQCPYMGNADILTDELCDEILAAVSAVVSPAAAELSSLYEYCISMIAQTNYMALYEAYIDVLSLAPDCTAVYGHYEAMVEYPTIEGDAAARLESGIQGLLATLNVTDSLYGISVSGAECSVSSYQLSLMVDVISDYYYSICGQLEAAGISSESRYAEEARSQLGEVAVLMSSYLQTLCEKVYYVRYYFDDGVSQSVGSADLSGSIMRDTYLKWPWE